jgi:hypothetical protein
MAYTVQNGKLVKVRKDVFGVKRMVNLPSAPEKSKNAADKGHYGGSCNITRCQRPDSAFWYNHSTRAYYCRSCAHDLNYDHFNRKDAMEMWGHFLCTEGKVIEGDYQAIHDHYRKLFEEKHNAA